MSIQWIRDLPDDSYYISNIIRPGESPRIVIARSAFERVSDYTRSTPTSPSDGRIYRKNLGWREHMPDNWFIYIVKDDPADPKFQFHHPHLVEIVEDE